MSKRKETRSSVTAKCVCCGLRREILPGEVPAGEVPICKACGSPMIATKAKAQPVREARP